MLKWLSFVTAMLVSCLAYAANPSATLTVKVTPTGGCQPLSGSILPPGTWCNDFDEEFPGNTLNTNNWHLHSNGDLAGSHCEVPGLVVVNNGLTMYALQYGYTNENNNGNGCQITSNGFSTPGYFEVNAFADTAGNTTSGVYFEVGPNGSCGGDVAQNGVEVDLLETYAGSTPQQNIFYDGYSNCGSGGVNINTVGGISDNDGYHVFGMDYGDNGAITLYRDGAVTGTYSPSDGVGAGTFNGVFYLFDYSIGGSVGGCAGSQPCGNGAKFVWVRHYHH